MKRALICLEQLGIGGVETFALTQIDEFNRRGIKCYVLCRDGILRKHIDNMRSYGVSVVVAVNSFITDTDAEKQYVVDYCKEIGVKCAMAEVFAKGGEGGVELANALCETIENEKSNYAPLYDVNLSIKEKINTVATKIYGASGVLYTKKAEKKIKFQNERRNYF